MLGLVQDAPLVLAGIAVVALTELARSSSWQLATCIQAVAAATVVLTTTHHGSAAFPLLLLAVFRAGDRGRPRDVLAVAATTALTLLAGWQPLHRYAQAGSTLLADSSLWLGLATGLGMLQCFSLRQAGHDASGTERAAEEAAGARVIQVGAWSLAFSRSRTQRSTPASSSRGASVSFSSRWSMRRPEFFGQWSRK